MVTFDPNYQEAPALAQVGQKVVIFNDQEKILFLRRSQLSSRPGGWDLPGGAIDLGEDPTQAILREISEETNLTVYDLVPIHAASKTNEQGNFVILIGYKAKTKDLMPQLSWEHDGFEWLTQDKAVLVDLPPIHSVFLKKAL